MVGVGKRAGQVLELHPRCQLGHVLLYPGPEVSEHGRVFGGVPSDKDSLVFGVAMSISPEIAGYPGKITGDTFHAETIERVMICVDHATALSEHA